MPRESGAFFLCLILEWESRNEENRSRELAFASDPFLLQASSLKLDLSLTDSVN